MSAQETVENLDLSDFAFDIPCGAKPHDNLGHTGPAEWIVTCQPKCGCPPHHVLTCDDCLNYALRQTWVCTWTHTDCGRTFVSTFAETVIRTERLR